MGCVIRSIYGDDKSIKITNAMTLSIIGVSIFFADLSEPKKLKQNAQGQAEASKETENNEPLFKDTDAIVYGHGLWNNLVEALPSR